MTTIDTRDALSSGPNLRARPASGVIRPHRLEAHAGSSLFVVAQDLQLDGQIHLAHADAPGHGEHDGSEVEDARDARADEAIGRVLSGGRRGGHDTDADPARLHDL